MADDLSLMDWLNNHIFPAEAMYVDADMVYHGSILAIAEMILSGTTTFADGYFFENRIAQAAESAGIRAVAAEGFIDFSPPDDKSCRKHLHKAEAFIRQWSDSSLVTPALFCHSPLYLCISNPALSQRICKFRRGPLFYSCCRNEGRDKKDARL